MADITNTQAVNFTLNTARPLADAYVALYWAAKRAYLDYVSKGGMAIIPNDSSIVMDGSATSGNNVVTGADVNVLLAHLSSLVSDMEASSGLKLAQVMKASTGYSARASLSK